MTDIYLFSIYEADKLSTEYCISHFPERFAKACRYKNKKDKLLCISAGYLISEILKCEEKDLSLGENGKPILKDVFFNISHSGIYSVLVRADSQVGIDIEYEDYRHLSLANEIFSPEEINLSNNNMLEKFYLLWTLKESFLKNIGTGLIDNISKLSVLDAFEHGYITYNHIKYFCKSFEYNTHICSICKESPFDNVNINLLNLNSNIDIKSEIKILL